MGYLTHFGGEADIIPPIGKELADQINEGGVYNSHFAPFRISDNRDTLEVYEGDAKWYDAAKNLTTVVNRLVQYGYEVSGLFTWQGEDPDDFGEIYIVLPNHITYARGKRVISNDSHPVTGREGNFHG